MLIEIGPVEIEVLGLNRGGALLIFPMPVEPVPQRAFLHPDLVGDLFHRTVRGQNKPYRILPESGIVFSSGRGHLTSSSIKLSQKTIRPHFLMGLARGWESGSDLRVLNLTGNDTTLQNR